jgi:hypothetical protein
MLGINGAGSLIRSVGGRASMNKFFRTVVSVAVANLLLFWIVYGILLAPWPRSGLSQTLGFSPPEPLSPWQALLIWAYVVLGAPGSIILDGTGGNNFVFLQVLCSILNCIIWGLFFGSFIYAVRKRFHTHAAQQGAGT